MIVKKIGREICLKVSLATEFELELVKFPEVDIRVQHSFCSRKWAYAIIYSEFWPPPGIALL